MTIGERIQAIDWTSVGSELEEYGVGRLGRVLTPGECEALQAHYDDDGRFRSRIVMARHGFGRGEYKYFSHPLPEPVVALREAVYGHAVEVANRWAETLGLGQRYPETLRGMLERCHAAGQTRPTPLMLRYGPGDYNCLHQDVYGPHVFPLQLVVLLSERNAFEGGEFLLTEQRPRMQSRAEVVSLAQGEAALFAVNERPRKGAKGYHRVRMRHGVSRVRTGQRFTLGVIFHDAA